jgi:hypothetical protein
MTQNLRTMAFAAALFAATSDLLDASTSAFELPVTHSASPKVEVGSAYASIMVGATFRSVSVSY